MSDKRLGYLILTIALLIIAVILVYSLRILAFPKEKRVISFDRISNLRIDDPVEIMGKTVGRIKNVTGENRNVFVTVEFNETVTIYSNYRIYTYDKGIVGDRRLVIEPGHISSPIIDKSDTLNGIFYLGISDVLGHAWKLKDFFTAFKDNAAVLLSGTEEKPSFITSFTSVISEIDTISSRLYNAAVFLDSELTHGIDTLNSVITAAASFIEEVKRIAPEKINSVEKKIETISNFIGKLDTAVTTLTDIVIRIKNNELLHVDHITKILQQLKVIQGLIEELQTGTARLKLRLKLGF